MLEGPALQIDTNVDDMDPRLWPDVLDRLLAAGAFDAWLTPIVMKKGRPAFTLSVLCDETRAAELRALIFDTTTTIGVREHRVDRTMLRRRVDHVDVEGHAVAIKVAGERDEPTNVSVEWADVAAAADALGLTPKQVLGAATAAAHGGETAA